MRALASSGALMVPMTADSYSAASLRHSAMARSPSRCTLLTMDRTASVWNAAMSSALAIGAAAGSGSAARVPLAKKIVALGARLHRHRRLLAAADEAEEEGRLQDAMCAIDAVLKMPQGRSMMPILLSFGISPPSATQQTLAPRAEP